MSIIIYGGDRATIEKQLKCDHDWHGPCMDNISRYFKCTKCFCMDRDLSSVAAYYEALKEDEAYLKGIIAKQDEEIKDLNRTLANLRTSFLSFAGSVDQVFDACSSVTPREE
jgi:hypothetical protein